MLLENQLVFCCYEEYCRFRVLCLCGFFFNQAFCVEARIENFVFLRLAVVDDFGSVGDDQSVVIVLCNK